MSTDPWERRPASGMVTIQSPFSKGEVNTHVKTIGRFNVQEIVRKVPIKKGPDKSGAFRIQGALVRNRTGSLIATRASLLRRGSLYFALCYAAY